MNGEQANLSILMTLRDKASEGIRRIDSGFAGLVKRSEKLRASLGKVRAGLVKGLKVGAGVAAAGLGFLALNVKAGIDSLAQLEVLNKKTARALKTTGKAAWITTDQIRDMSNALEDLTKVDDKVIQNGANLLLSFREINKKAFEPALRMALDLSEGLGKDLNGSIRLVGRALNDPIKGLASLTRVGVNFTEKEKEKIAALVKSGNILTAQRTILRKLSTMFGGQATAAADSYTGQMSDLGDSVETLQQNLALALLPALRRVANRISTFLKAPQVQEQVRQIGEALASLFSPQVDTSQKSVGDALGEGLRASLAKSPFDMLAEKVTGAFTAIQQLPWETIKQHVSTVLSVGQQALSIFESLPKEVQAGLITVLAMNKVTGGALGALGKTALDLALKAVTTIMAGNVTVIGKTVTPGVPGAPGGPAGPPSPGAPTVPMIGAGIFMEQLQYLPTIARIEEAARQQGQLQTTLTGDVKTALTGTISGTLASIREKHANLVGISGTGNDLMRQIEADAQATRQNTSAMTTKQQFLANSFSRAIPIFGGIRAAVGGVQRAVATKDMSVTVRTSFYVSAREIASEVQRVTNNSGRVVS